MQALTSAVLAAFAVYAGSWYFGLVEGNFALLLFLATVVTGATDVAVAALEGSRGEAICGTLPVPEIHTHLPAAAVLIF